MSARQDEASRAFFEALAARWDEQQPTERAVVLRRLLRPFADRLSAARRILEVGTGTGALIPCLVERAPDARVASIDLARAMLRRAQERGPDVWLLQADVHALPFSGDSASGGVGAFDLVVCHNSFPHFVDRPAALGELARTLVAEGELLILHDLSRARVNAIHGGAGGPIKDHLLPAGEETQMLLMEAGFAEVWVEDGEEGYRAGGRRPAG